MNRSINKMKMNIPIFAKRIQEASNSDPNNNVEIVNTNVEFNEPSTPSLINVNSGEKVHMNTFNSNIYKNFGGSRKGRKSKASRKSKKAKKAKKTRKSQH
jgi:hypothetical protein